MEETEMVTYQQWNACARRVFNKNIREKGKSLSESGICRRAHGYILDIYPGRDDDHGTMRVKKGWRKAMQTEDAQPAAPYQPGQWIRYYTNSLRGPGAITHVGKIITVLRAQTAPQPVVGYIARNAIATHQVSPGNIVGLVEVDETTMTITRDCPPPDDQE